MFLRTVAIVVLASLIAIACQGDPATVAVPAHTPVSQPADTPAQASTSAPTATLAPTESPTATAAPTLAPTTADTPVPPTNTPEPTNTPPPTNTPTPEPTPTNAPAPTRTPRPTSASRPTATPGMTSATELPSQLAGLENADKLWEESPQRAEKIARLPWVGDGVSEDEREAAELLIGAAIWYPREFGVMAEFPWVEGDSITAAETDALFGFRWTPRYSSDHAQPLLQMSWAQQEITEQEGEAIKYLYRTARYAPELATPLFGKPWVQDGITPHDLTAIKNLHWMARPEEMDELVWLNAPSEAEYHQLALELSLQIANARWLQDSPDRHEAEATQRLSWMFGRTPELATKAWQKPWLSDDITRDEVVVLDNIDWLARPKDDKFVQQTLVAALGILDMPFLENLSSEDILAVRSLQNLESDDTAAFLEVMNHPKLRDGITDSEAKLVALLHAAPDLAVHILRDEDRLHSEERTIRLPHSGEVLLVVARFYDEASMAMELLEAHVRTIEEYLGEPFPTDRIVLVFRDWDAGQYTFGHTGILMKMSSGYYLGSNDWNGRTSTRLASMVARYYVNFEHVGPEQRWITSGFATFMSDASQLALGKEPYDWWGCAKVDTIAALEALDTQQDGITRCHLAMGNSLMHAMHEELGEDAFKAGIAALHRMTLADAPPEGCEGTDLTICHVEAAFKAGASDAIAAQVDEVLDRWYGPRE